MPQGSRQWGSSTPLSLSLSFSNYKWWGRGTCQLLQRTLPKQHGPVSATSSKAGQLLCSLAEVGKSLSPSYFAGAPKVLILNWTASLPKSQHLALQTTAPFGGCGLPSPKSVHEQDFCLANLGTHSRQLGRFSNAQVGAHHSLMVQSSRCVYGGWGKLGNGPFKSLQMIWTEVINELLLENATILHSRSLKTDTEQHTFKNHHIPTSWWTPQSLEAAICSSSWTYLPITDYVSCSVWLVLKSKKFSYFLLLSQASVSFFFF